MQKAAVHGYGLLSVLEQWRLTRGVESIKEAFNAVLKFNLEILWKKIVKH